MTAVLLRDRKGHTDTQGESHVRQRQRRELCCHKPRAAWSHQKLEETMERCPLEPSERTWL